MTSYTEFKLTLIGLAPMLKDKQPESLPQNKTKTPAYVHLDEITEGYISLERKSMSDRDEKVFERCQVGGY